MDHDSVDSAAWGDGGEVFVRGVTRVFMRMLDYSNDSADGSFPVSITLGMSSIILLLGYVSMRYGLGDDFWFLNWIAALTLIPPAGIVAVIGMISGYRKIRSGSNLRSNSVGVSLNCIAILLTIVLIRLELK